MNGASSKGIELGLEGLWSSGLRGRVSYTLQQSEDRVTGNRLIDSPNHLAKANLILPLYKEKLFAGVEFQYSGDRVTAAGARARGYGIANLTLFSQNLLKGLELSASVYNLFDRRYSDPATSSHLQDLIQQDGRSLRVKMTYQF